MKQINIRIHGNVQGVFYRSFVEDEAQKLRITGWVRNEPDGSVRVVAQGGEAFLKKFERAVRKGPPTAVVTFVSVHWQEPTETFSSFEMVS